MLEESRVPDHAGFGTLGLDFILAAELARRVNDRLGTALRAIDFYDHPTLADLAAAIEGDGANRSAPASSLTLPPRPELHVLRAVVRGAVAEALYTEPGTIADDAGFHDLGLDFDPRGRACEEHLGAGLDRIASSRNLRNGNSCCAR